MSRYQPKKLKSPAKAIREFCIECMGGRGNEGYMKQISDCGSPDCALFEFRFGKNPFHKKHLTDEQKKVKADQLKTSFSADKISKKLPLITHG
tara:strand:+ start:79 stop:357 length:279 start_codon:yes stop_codon:yes gene_type:complete